MSLRAGRLRQRIDIVRPVEVDNETGGYSVDLQPIALAVPAEVLGAGGREAQANGVVQTVAAFRICMRYRADVEGETDLQVRYGKFTLNVRSAVDPDGRREQLLLGADTGGTLAT